MKRWIDSLAVLRRARKVIADHDWTVMSLARDRAHNDCHPCSTDAVSFCARGALDRALFELKREGFAFPPEIDINRKFAADALEHGGLERWNRWLMNNKDGSREPFGVTYYNDLVANGKADALAWFDAAIEQCKRWMAEGKA